MDSKPLAERLQQLGLTYEEAQIYLTLLEGGPSTHLQISRETGVSRSKVYRLVEQLQQRGLTSHHIDDTGRYIAASDPENLLIQLTVDEKELEGRRYIANSVIRDLSQAKNPAVGKGFIVREYQGDEGFRQMLWQELKTKGELLVLGGATIEELAPNARWADRYRAAILEADYNVRELLNERRWDIPFTAHNNFKNIYSQRYIDKSVLNLSCQITIFNDTVNTYHWRNGQRVGLVVVNPDYAMMMRQIFEKSWLFATEPQGDMLHPDAPVAVPPHGSSPDYAKGQS